MKDSFNGKRQAARLISERIKTVLFRALVAIALSSRLLAAQDNGGTDTDIHKHLRALIGGSESVPLHTALLYLAMLRGIDSAQYARAVRDAVDPKWSRGTVADSALRHIDSVYNGIRASIRSSATGLPPDLAAPLPSGPSNLLGWIHDRGQALAQNPFHQGLSILVQDVGIRAARSMLAISTQEDLQRFEKLSLPPGVDLTDARAFLTADAKRAVSNALQLESAANREEAERLMLKTLQREASRLEVASIVPLVGAANEAQVDTIANALTGTVGFARSLATIDAEFASRVHDHERALNEALTTFASLLKRRADSVSSVTDLNMVRGGLEVLNAAVVSGSTGDLLKLGMSFFDTTRRDLDDIRTSLRSVVEQREALSADTRTYLSAGATLMGQLGPVFHIPQETINAVTTGANVAVAAIGIASDIAAQNYVGAAFGAIGLIGDLFGGGGGPDIATQRQQQLLDEFSVLRAAMKQMLDLQVETLKEIQALDLKIDSLSVQASQNHTAVMQRLDSLSEKLGFSVRVQSNPDWVNLTQCQTVIEEVVEKPANYGELHAAAQQMNAVTKACLDMLVALSVDMSGGGVVHRVFWVDNYAAQPEGSDARLLNDVIYSPIRSYFSDVWRPANRMDAKRFDAPLRSALASPSLTYSDLLNKLFTLANRSAVPHTPPGVLKQPLLDSAAIVYARYVLALHPMLLILHQPDEQVLDSAVFFSPNKWGLAAPTLAGELLVARALAVVDEAAAFQTLNGGDILLPDLADALLTPNVAQDVPARDSIRARAFSPTTTSALLYTNGTLAANAVRYALYESKQRAIEPVTPDQYAAAIAKRDTAQLRKLFERVRQPDRANPSSARTYSLAFSTRNDSVFISAAKRLVPLPSVEEYEEGRFLPTTSLQRLWPVRDALLDALTEYQLRRHLTNEDRRALMSILSLVIQN